jgi:uncharacterized protein GlcG (DUF336 family)
MPLNCEEKCKEPRFAATNGTNETYRFPYACLVGFTFGCRKGGVAREESAYARSLQENCSGRGSGSKKRRATVVIVVVDDGGHLLLLERLDDTQVASVEVGIGKARTAAIFRRPSKVFEDQVRDGRIAALALPGATPLQGGVPIIYEGKVIGAIGVSGNTPQEDEDIAKVGAASTAAAIAN